MPKQKTGRESLTQGQLAKRWGVAPRRIEELIREGSLPGTFVIPPSGRFGKTTKIPLATVVEAEKSWRIEAEAGPTTDPVSS